ncbi:MAG: efflux RND transporter periplasmic adaptor subunit [Rhodobiaceae bacterium]|nr:efflux RND transporter periplasmic adaptor subunit [Rhodobiaceae bacterium]
MKPPGEIITAGRPTLLARVARAAVMLALAAAVLGAGVFAYDYLKRTRAEVPRRPAVERVWSVRTLPVVFTDHRPTLVTYGTATPSRRVDLRALVSGEIVSVSPDLREGGVVDAGEELLRIDEFDYQGARVEARANLAEARARLAEIEAKIALETDGLAAARTQLDIARRDLERVEAIVARGAVSEKTVDDRRMVEVQRAEAVTQRENQLAIERARADQQRAAIERLEWRVRQAERDVASTVLHAPFDAYVSNVTVQPGRLVGINDAVATLVDARSLDVRFVLTDAEFGRIADDAGSVVGRPVTVTWQVGETPRSFAATVERVTPQIEAARGGIEVFARIADADMKSAALLPRPGAFVEVAIEDKAYRDTAQVPATALYGTDTLFVVVDERLAPRRVEIVGRSGNDLLVRGDLAAGERVVVTRITEAGEGVKVRDEAAAPAGGNQ